jgi:hypothetical protein
MENAELQIKYDELLKKYDDLLEECKENVIMESMNEMKHKYNDLVKHTVPVYKYNLLTKKYEVTYTTLLSCGAIIDHIAKVLKGLETRYDTSKILQAQLELIMLKDIINESLSEN